MDWEKTVFLAHATEDKPRVRELSLLLRESGLEPWLDEEALLPGDDWDNKIHEAINNSRIFLACLSNKSIRKDGYVQRELRLALSRMEEKPSGTTFFIPALLEPVDVPNIRVGSISINTYQFAFLYQADGFDRLLSALSEYIPITSKHLIVNLENIVKSKSMVLSQSELEKNRTDAEVNLIKEHFPEYKIRKKGNRITRIEGNHDTGHGTVYDIRIEVPTDFPNELPKIFIADSTNLSGCPHRFTDGSICIMSPQQLSQGTTLYSILVKTMLWLQHCEIWKKTGYWY